MKRRTVHKYGRSKGGAEHVCGSEAIASDLKCCVRKWRTVTCKNCLKFKPN